MTNVSKEMIDAGAAILDPLLDSHCPRQVARDVYAAMEEAKASLHSSVTLRPVDPSERPTPLRPFAFAESQVYEVPADRIGRVVNSPQTATSDGRW